MTEESGSEQPGIELDIGRWPTCVVRPKRAVEDDELDEFLMSFRELIADRNEPYGMVLDLRLFSGMGPVQRKRISDEVDSDVNNLCRGTAMVFESTVMKMLLTAILWVARPPQPLKVFSDFQEAQIWANMMARSEDTAASG